MKTVLPLLLSFLFIAGAAWGDSTCQKPAKKSPAKADLVITAIQVVPATKPGSKETIVYTIKNQGKKISPMSAAQLQVGSDEAVILRTPAIKPDGSYTYSVQYDLSEGKKYVIKAKADYLNKVPETNDRNNENTISFGIGRKL